MEKEFLTNLGIENDTAEKILSEIGRSENELFAGLSEEARDLRISIAAKNEGVRDEEIFRLIIGDSSDISAATEKAKLNHGWLFNMNKTPVFSCRTAGTSQKPNPFAHGAGLD